MPEIKHQFTGGKMNKDLDERLIPNGEYRDALNIQVSTSEGSDVGTVQNILGNSLISGQDFIGENAVCVGSIADEKNDKLYYFIAQGVSSAGVTVESEDHPYWGAFGVGKYFYFDESALNNILGYNYPSNGVFRITTRGGNGNIKIDNQKAILFTSQSSNAVSGFAHGRLNSNPNIGDFAYGDVVFIDNGAGQIIEYNSKANSIIPVVVDTARGVLKFDSDNIITGISIIDDLLFWTDNENEPKKININRCKKGTDPSGTIHTIFINDKRNDSFGDIREEHITVIKKAPNTAPTIELFSERALDEGQIHTGVMRITSAPSPPTVANIYPNTGLFADANLQNESSLWVHPMITTNHLHDFKGMKVGDIFDTQIETDINGDSGFELSWANGDIILFKEFGGENFDIPPEIPLKDYVIKAKILDHTPINSVLEAFTPGNPPFNFTDNTHELAQNGDFIIPNYNGGQPKHYGWNQWSYFTYAPINDYVQFTDCNWQHVFYGTPEVPFVQDGEYDVSFTISGAVNNGARLQFYIMGDSATFFLGTGNVPYWKTSSLYDNSANGTHNYTFKLNAATAHTSEDYANYTNSTTTIPNFGVDLSGKFFMRFDDLANSGDGFTCRLENISITRSAGVNINAAVRCEVQSINEGLLTTLEGQSELRYAVDKIAMKEKLFEFKFPRFAYRYQYEDREYSTISPFSPIAFVPGSFDYHPKKGYNLGMTNRVHEIGIKNFATNVPDGVVAIDILYKDDSSPSIYVVDTIKPKHSPLIMGSNTWDENAFVITSEQISQMLPSNQSLRLWDAVPKKALAQDISGNRIIYGNYTQGFDLKAGGIDASEEYNPDFNFSIKHNDNIGLNPKKSIKSLREYQLGVVFVDEYGRETPVISNKSGTHRLDKLEAKKINEIQVDFNNEKFPENMKYFKFFIKETSGEYYNLAMDRHYDAEDGQIWLSFPSSDRNKLDIDTFLILKKGIESNEMVEAEAKYKVLDIQSEAPDFIKQTKQLIEEKKHIFADDTSDVFGGNSIDVPLLGLNDFKMNYDLFADSPGSNLHEVKDDLYVEFTNDTKNTSKRYRITSITTDYIDGIAGEPIASATYSVKIHGRFGDDVNFISDDEIAGLNVSKIKDGTIVNIYKYSKENSPKFDGRFFVKINVDISFNESMTPAVGLETAYRTVLSKKLYYLHSGNTSLHRNAMTGQDRGVYKDSFNPHGAGNFGSFAPFFRNYNWIESAGDHAEVYDTGIDVHIGQYYFGYKHTFAAKELAWITTDPTDDGFTRSSGSGSQAETGTSWPGVRIADKHGDYITGDGYWTDDDRYGVFNSAGEQTKGDVWFIDGGPYAFTTPNDNLDWGNADAAGGTGTGMANGTIDIGMGGIYSADSVNDAPNNIPGFYNIGNSGLSTGFKNLNYTPSSTEALVNKFYPGQKFRFKEDPSGEVYTIQQDIAQSRRLRWQSKVGFSYDDSTTNVFLETSFLDNSIQLSPNFSKNWIPTFVNSSGGSTVNWNPTGDPGPISGGLSLAVDHSSAGVWDGTNQPYVTVTDLNATDENGLGDYTITTGMILTSHSDAAVTYSTTTSLSTPGKANTLAVQKIEEHSGKYRLYLSGYIMPLTDSAIPNVAPSHNIFDAGTQRPNASEELIFKQPKMNGYSQYSVNRINAQHGDNNGGMIAVGYTLEFVESIELESLMPSNPAIWETEPKESTDLDIYYEAGGKNPLRLEDDTRYLAIPLFSTVEHIGGVGVPNWIEPGTEINSIAYGVFSQAGIDTGGDSTGWHVGLTSPSDDPSTYTGSLVGNYIAVNDRLKITKPNGDIVIVEITGWPTSNSDGRTKYFRINSALYGDKTQYNLNWHNCYSFGNGVESNRVRDDFNLPYMSNGAKVSTTLNEGHGEENRTSGLIYSGIYNSTSSINNLNQFIAAEKITKDINPIYGSIQKLHSRDSDLVTLCEDKCLRILANKDAVYNADGNPQLTANINVLGQTIPFSGEFGISKNPESFASESYRVYFTDKVRGAVMRLSKDGLTPISNHGMKDWFKDNLKLSTKLIGSYDDRKEEYNITLANRKYLGEELIVNGNFDNGDEGWDTTAAGWSIGGGVATYSGTAYNYIEQQLSGIIAGETYRITFTNTTSAGNPLVVYLGGTNTSSPHVNTTGLQSVDLIAGSTDSNLWFLAGNQGTRWNGTIDNISVKKIISDPLSLGKIEATTVSFKEDVRGWVSFKSFVPENALSMANDYYTVLNGKLYKHHVEGANRNNFYNTDYNSSVNVILNDGPGSVKSFHTLAYEGSQSRVEGIKSVTVGVDSLTGVNPNGFAQGLYFYFNTKSEMDDLLGYAWDSGVVSTNIKQYRGGTLIREGFIYLANTPTTFGFLGRWNVGFAAGDWEVGDIITTQEQEDSVNYFNVTLKDGWYVNSIKTDKQVGNIHEFIEKEGKWFNYIKGIDSDITPETDFGASDIQGIGFLKQTITSANSAEYLANNPTTGSTANIETYGWDWYSNKMEFDSPINASLQIGDIIYYQQASNTTNLGGFDVIDPNEIVKFGKVTNITSNTVTIDETVFGGPNIPDPYHGAFIFFAKNHAINTSSLLGYFADVKFENNSTDKIELFSVGSEITESSK